MNHNHEEYFKMDFLISEVSKERDFAKAAEIFSILSDSTRLKIFWLLCHSRECVLNIAEIFKITMPAVSHHLKILKEAGFIESWRDGKEVFYSAAATKEVRTIHEIIEKMMSMTCPDFNTQHEKINENSAYLENQVDEIKKVHDYLIRNLSRRITIEELAKNFAMNTTTLKTVFKDVYGTSIAAHIKKHRMEKALSLLENPALRINEIAAAVGYESQSKFSAAFREEYGKSPAEYRR